MAGSVVEEKATQQRGLEITVQLDSGEVIAIVQAADVSFDEGDQVRVLRRPNGEARVVQ
jgi:outer membrane lipoprotein SlyB